MSDNQPSQMGEMDDSRLDNHEGDYSLLREQDRFLPIANVTRIMKKVLPTNAKISKDAKECIQECVSEFVSFITGEASDRCKHEKRKTINGDDIIWAMQNLGFDMYVEPMRIYLQKYRDSATTKRSPSKNDTDNGYPTYMSNDMNVNPFGNSSYH